MLISKNKLEKLYGRGLSMQEIALKLGCSGNKVKYWMVEHGIKRRSISEAVYARSNPNGDPFNIKELQGIEDIKLFYTAIGLYLGEGDKKSRHLVKMANTDPYILRIFLKFLREICDVREIKIGAELNIFNDVNLKKAINFWISEVGITREQLKTMTVRESRGGSYKKKSEYGTLSIYFANTKLKKIIIEWCEKAVIA